MLNENLADIPIISGIAAAFGIIKAAITSKNKIDIKKLISKTTDEFLPTLDERTKTVLDKVIVVRARA